MDSHEDVYMEEAGDSDVEDYELEAEKKKTNNVEDNVDKGIELDVQDEAEGTGI